MKKIQYILFSIMYIVLNILCFKGLLMLISEFLRNKDFSIVIYIGIALFALLMFSIALYNCIKKIFE